MKDRISTIAAIALALSLFALAGYSLAEGLTESVGKLVVVIPAQPPGLAYFPDEQISILGKNPFRMLMVAGNATVLLEGPAMAKARTSGIVLGPGGPDDFDNGYAGVTSVVSPAKGRRGECIAFYHAEDHVGMPKVSYNNDIHGAYWSIGVAYSSDNCKTFKKGGQVLRSRVSKQDVTKEHQGIGDPHVIVDASGTHLLAYYTDISRRAGDERTRVGLAKCDISDAGAPGKWNKYHDGQFSQHGLGGDEDAIVRGPTEIPCEVSGPHVTWVPKWNHYVMVLSVLSFSDFEKQSGDKGGLFWCLSEDGIKWTEPRQLCSGLTVPLVGKEYVAHPTLVVESATDSTVKGQVYFAYSPRWGTQAPNQPHFLARRSVALRR